MPSTTQRPRCRVAVLWIDWYPYHVARFRGLLEDPTLQGMVVGLELVGGVGVHKGLKFREALPTDLPIETLLPQTSWQEAGKLELSRLLWQRLNVLQPELVLVPGYYTLPALTAAVWARMHGRASVLMTESTAGDHPRSWWKELPKRLVLRLLFGGAVTGGTAHVAYLRQLGFPAERIAGSYDVVDNAGIGAGVQAARATVSPQGAPSPYFLYVGRLAAEKNVGGLLAAWVAYREQGGSWSLVLCGDGPERATLEAAAARSGFGHDVIFPGLKASQALYPIYAHAGCFVLPSAREPWGLVVNEAMAAGLPVLVSRRAGCAPDLVYPGENGFLFDPHDSAQLAGLLGAMEHCTAAQRDALGRRSAEIIEGFTPRGFGAAVASLASQHHRPAPTAWLPEVTG